MRAVVRSLGFVAFTATLLLAGAAGAAAPDPGLAPAMPCGSAPCPSTASSLAGFAAACVLAERFSRQSSERKK